MSETPIEPKESKPEAPPTKQSRARQILLVADCQKEIENAWECVIDFQRITKAVESPMAAKALHAAAYINRLRSVVEVPQTDKSEITPDLLARRFHELYEKLAPIYGYETRKESAKPWEEVPDNNKRLMTAVAAEIIKELSS